jgi:hypothetical protein
MLLVGAMQTSDLDISALAMLEGVLQSSRISMSNRRGRVQLVHPFSLRTATHSQTSKMFHSHRSGLIWRFCYSETFNYCSVCRI